MKNSGTVRFLLNGDLVQIDFHGQTPFTPTTTLLEYLRSDPGLCGTKEGCAEGDCGACTVVLVPPDSKQTAFILAIDACLVFLPMVHGKAVITVEHIGKLDQLHPVQQAMVDYDGSQCGYCTPGFIMSLFAVHENHSNPDDSVIADALTGNLCRCTGYRSIMDAARAVSRQRCPREIISDTLVRCTKLETYPLAIIREDQKYFQPASLPEALRLRSMYPSAILVNGATDVALKVTKNDELIQETIDLSNISELQKFERSDKTLTFGAGLSLERVNQESKESLPALGRCLAVFGSLQIRNLATLGGNLASASPIGDTIPILMAYDAILQLASSGSTRNIPIREFVTGYRETQLRTNEIIVSITIPKPKPSSVVSWYKISKRKDLDISTVSGGFYLELDATLHVKQIKLFYGGMASKTSPAQNTVEFLTGKSWTRKEIQKAATYIDNDFNPISDARANAEGRQVMARNLLWKFWSETHAKQ